MKVNQIELHNIGKIKDMIINLNHSIGIHNQFGDLNLNVLVGENGTGKTTLLKFLSEVFFNHPMENFLAQSRYKINYVLNDQVFEATNKDYNPHTIPDKVIVSTFSPYEQFNRTIKHAKSRYRYIGAASQHGIRSLYIPLIEILSQRNNKKNFAINKFLEEIGYIEDPYIEVTSSKLSETEFINEHRGNSHSRILNHYSYYGRENIVRGKKLLAIADIQYYDGGIRAWINDIKKLKIHTTEFIETIWFPKGSAVIPITSFSSGEFTLFYRFFRLIDQIVDNSIVLIDEPETHLHPKWIKKYINLLVTVFNHYKAHFFIATHSPFIVSDLPSSSIVGLYNDEHQNTRVYRIKEETMGASPREILRTVFQLEENLGDFTLEFVGDIEDLIERDKYEEALRMYDTLGESQYKYYLFTKLNELRRKLHNNVDDKTSRFE